MPVIQKDLRELNFVGTGFSRPECVLATQNGDLFASDKRGGVAWLDPAGTLRVIGKSDIIPNGIALLRDRSFVAANLAGVGGVWRIRRDGQVEPYILEIDGVRLPGVNFVGLDDAERLWICVSTMNPEAGAYSQDSRDGFIALHDASGTRIVADNMCWTNECRVTADGAHLLVNETFARRITRFRIAPDGGLSHRDTVTEFGPGVFPDGLQLDAAGGAWVVSVGSNRVIYVAPDGAQTVVIDDGDPEQVAALERLHQHNKLTRTVLSECRGSLLTNTTSIVFGGPDLRTAYLGSLGGAAIASFRVETPGLKPVHWTW
jgi:sugar lactone lactonase YvrE